MKLIEVKNKSSGNTTFERNKSWKNPLIQRLYDSVFTLQTITIDHDTRQRQAERER